METGVDGQTSGGDIGCTNFHVCFVVEPFGVVDGPSSLRVERAENPREEFHCVMGGIAV